MILADASYFPALDVVPLFAFASVLNVGMTQFCLGLNLSKKNIFVAVATIFGGITAIVANSAMQGWLGITAAGYAQILAYIVAGVIVYRYSRKYMPIDYDLNWASIPLLIVGAGIGATVVTKQSLSLDPYLAHFAFGAISIIALIILGESKYRFAGKLLATVRTRTSAG